MNKLKALGNAIVPMVAYELMLMMLAVDDACDSPHTPDFPAVNTPPHAPEVDAEH